MSSSIRRILVAVKDVRGRASPAIRKAAQLARALDAQLELFHAMCDPLPVDALMFVASAVQKTQDAARARFLRRLEAFAKPLRRSGLTVTTTAEWDYPAHEALVRRARQARADLIVAELHAGRHAAPRFLRYTDWELVRHSPVPVLLVRTRGAYATPRVLAAVDPSHAFAKTAGLDEEILRNAARFADTLRGSLHVGHAYMPSLVGSMPAEFTSPEATARIIREAQKLAEQGLDKALRSARLGKLSTTRRHLVARHPIDAIPLLVGKLHADLVVMGAVSRSGLKGLLIGNTAERLRDDLTCDLLVVKSPSFVSRVSARSRGPQFVSLPLPGAV
jgi:universal stress protein E